jgi:hypothetical protein
MFIQIQDGQPVGHAVVEDNLRVLFPHHVFPKLITPADVEPFGFGIYEFTQIPPDRYPNKIIETTPVLRENGIWYQAWSEVEMTAEEQEVATTQEANQMRTQRNFRLMQSDWSQLPDAKITAEKKTEWVTYRQALRDITDQAGFPWTITWPTQPSE